MTALLQVENLTIRFPAPGRGLGSRKELTPVQGLSLSVGTGEIVAVVGSSGSGKSLLAHAVLGILPRQAKVTGTLRFRGEELTLARQAAVRGREIALVPQSVTFLDPLLQAGRQVRYGVNEGDPAAVQRSLFRRYRLAEAVEKLFPFQLSGGMARRVLLAAATAGGAGLVIADEPTPGLDSEAVREALGRLRELADGGCGVMLITHDIESALTVADRVAVLYSGTVVETAAAAEFAGRGEALRHPYTRALWRALPGSGFTPLPGFQPAAGELPPGCAFAPRCGQADTACRQERPPLRELRGGTVRCVHAT
ncbi:ABC transporter ATP-binding protein [Paenibacillus mucilaginosus]|uniref:oligopeptide/dipeptide ABC transporter ATP-binding protein n=1 Tax=Paenibacillus mucilaginosus TaxID=61624 RepID=UPI001EF00078|nr:ABC transporter ATP-binding protein [Paenibacillus mucilaginosus]MCG7214111.1 ABC transporter ATP-binding protein [Paenibacillus mucilaginosus]WDM28633.1 ABC transporter ATP-binding protein [Paenibacillus mucilaginosus]